jgi:hypothetical protein
MRLQAVARLAEIAGYDHLDPEATLARKPAVEILIRHALHCASTGLPRSTYRMEPLPEAPVRNELLEAEVRELGGVALGRAWLLDDAVYAGGLGEATQQQMTVSELQEAFTAAWGAEHVS